MFFLRYAVCIVSIAVPFFWFNQFYMKDPKRQPQQGTTMETIGIQRWTQNPRVTIEAPALPFLLKGSARFALTPTWSLNNLRVRGIP